MKDLMSKEKFTLISGPCSLESENQIDKQFENNCWKYLRAGIYKLRSSPHTFQGLREEGIELIKNLKKKYNFSLVTEVVSEASLEALLPVIDCIQIGTRNMYNYELLKLISKTDKHIILKRAFSATIFEWIEAAKYIKDYEDRVILCERGIRSFEASMRNTLDLNAVAFIKKNTGFSIIVDPSHASGNRYLVPDLAKASLAVGADGLLIESHYNPDESFSDAKQAISINDLENLKDELDTLSPYFNKEFVY